VVDYWGAQAHYPIDSPGGYRTPRYYVEPQGLSVTYTQPRSDANTVNIFTIHQQFQGMHPEYISTLADEWQNAYDLLSHVRGQLLDRSNMLYHEYWKSPRAKEAFMKAGPGPTLAYLDAWMDAAQNNVSALRALVNITIKARKDMDDLWAQYERALEDAKYADGWTRFGQGFMQGATLGIYDAYAGIRSSETDAVKEVDKEYSGRAQDLAHRVAGEHVDAFAKVFGGYGPPFQPMDAVVNPVGHPPYLTATPPPPPPPPPNLVVPTIKTPTVTPTVTTPELPQAEQSLLVTPPQPPAAPDSHAPGVGVGDVPGLAGLGVMPVLPVGTAGLKAAPAIGAVPAKGVAGAPGSTPSMPPSARPGGLNKGVLQRQGASGQPPGAHPPPGKTLGRKRDEPGTDPSTPGQTEDAFTRPPGSATPPVLKRPQRTVRPGSTEELTPTTGMPDAALPGQSAAAPPVLNRPARRAADPRRTDDRKDRVRGDGPRPGTEWVGVDEAREDAAAPVLDAPAPARGASRLDEVPTQLRGRATSAGRSAEAGPPRGTVSPELAARRAVPTTGTPVPLESEDGQKIVTDEEAFSVETPGGGVLAKGREDTSYRAEPPTAVGGH
jgi:hypothetical protein